MAINSCLYDWKLPAVGKPLLPPRSIKQMVRSDLRISHARSGGCLVSQHGNHCVDNIASTIPEAKHKPSVNVDY